MLYYLLIGVHVITCLFLIAVILLQAGRGGGLTEAFGGGAQSVLGTQAPHILKKATTIGAILFLTISLLLAMVTARRGQSLLLQQMRIPAGPQAPYTTERVPLEDTEGEAQEAAEAAQDVAQQAADEAADSAQVGAEDAREAAQAAEDAAQAAQGAVQ